MRLSPLVLALPLLLLSPVCFAASGEAVSSQSGSVLTGTGDVLKPEDAEQDSLKNDRATRADDWKKNFKKADKLTATLRERRTVYLKKRAEKRQQCREDIRRSNRDTKLSTQIDCFQSDLTLERDYLGNIETYLKDVPGIQETLRSQALSRLDLLRDAIGTILFAIDSGVYGSTDDLTEARMNLQNRYREPMRDAIYAVEADRVLDAVSALILSVDAMREQERTILGTPERRDWRDTRFCLTRQETTLRSLVKVSTQPRGTALHTAIDAIRTCADSLQKISKTSTGQTLTVPSLQ